MAAMAESHRRFPARGARPRDPRLRPGARRAPGRRRRPEARTAPARHPVRAQGAGGRRAILDEDPGLTLHRNWPKRSRTSSGTASSSCSRADRRTNRRKRAGPQRCSRSRNLRAGIRIRMPGGAAGPAPVLDGTALDRARRDRGRARLRRADTRRRWVPFAALGLVVVLIAVRPGTRRRGRRRRYPSAWDPQVAPITSRCPALRGLSFEHAVPVRYLTDRSSGGRSRWSRRASRRPRGDVVKNLEGTLRAFGLISRGHGSGEVVRAPTKPGSSTRSTTPTPRRWSCGATDRSTSTARRPSPMS